MSEHAPDRVRSGIDIPKTVAAALAAVCAAVVGSYLGVAGTLVGAAVASVIGSVGTEIYHSWFSTGAKKLHTLAPAFITAPAAVGTPAVAAATEEDSPSHTVPEKERRKIRWGRIALIAGALFVLAMGTLTAVELITGKSVASTVGNSTGASTTVGGLIDPGRGDDNTPATTPSESPSANPTDATPAPQDKAPQPATAPTSEAPAPGASTQATTAPTTQAPQPTAPPTVNHNPNSGQGQSNP
jgi:hypothetical protein